MKQPLYKKLAAELRGEIYSGILKPGARLPSKRTLADEKKLSMMTVTGALELLEAEGLIYTEQRRGCFVSPDISPQPEKSSAEVTAPEQSEGTREYLYDLTSAKGAVEGFPFYTWARLMRETLSEKDTRLLRAIDPKGVFELRDQIARQLSLLRGIHCRPEQIVIGSGSEYLIGLIYQLIGVRSCAFESPGYTKAAKIYSHLGAELSFIPTDENGIRVELLDGVDAVQVTPSHSFPLGTLTSLERRRELIGWVAGGERYIIEDDFDSEFRYDGEVCPSIYSLDKSGRVIYMNTFTRTLAPSMRIGYMVLPPPLLERFEREFLFYSSTVPALEQYVLAKFIADGSFERHLSRMRRIYRRRRDAIIEELSSLGDRVEILGAQAGVHLLVRLKGGLREDEVIASADRLGIRLSGMSELLFPGTAQDGEESAIIVNFAGVDETGLREAIRMLKNELGSAEGDRAKNEIDRHDLQKIYK